MSVILCPTRGGQSSIPNQEYAIELAKKRSAQLIFLYISNIHFLDRVSAATLVDVSHELDLLGEFLLAMAKDRAKNAGITAHTICRQGEFQQNLVEVIEEHQVNTICIGRAAGQTGVTDDQLRENLAAFLQKKGIEVFILDKGRAIAHLEAST